MLAGRRGSPPLSRPPCAPRPQRRRRILWRRGTRTTRDTSRSASRPRCRCRRSIQHGMAGRRAEGKQQRAGEMIEQPVELLGCIGLVGPAQSQPRPEPGPSRADQTAVHQSGPAPQRAPGDHRLARAGEQRPLVGLLSPVAQDPYHRLEHRAEGRSPTPQGARHQGNRRTVTELGPLDRDVLQHLAGRQVLDSLAVPPAVRSGAASRAAGRTDAAGLAEQIDESNLPTLDRGEVVTQPRCEYTTDCLGRAGTGPFGSQTSRPRVRTFPFQIKLCVAKRVAQLNPVRAGSLAQSEIGTPSELRTE